MSGLETWLALASSLNPLDPREGIGRGGDLILRDLLLILGSGLILLVALLFWAKSYVRRSKRSRHRRHHHHASATRVIPVARSPGPQEPNADSSATATSTPDRRHHHRRHRRRRRDHRARNPTLAEAGGLPPQRSEPLPPSAL